MRKKNHYDQPQRNGFTLPLHYEQVLSWVAFLAEIVLYFTLIFPTLTPGYRIGITIPYCIIFVIYNTLLLIAASCKHESAYIDPQNDPKSHGFVCKHCNKYVYFRCKHCRCCNICRLNFDHHCFFLNNCVTKENYALFLSAVYFLMISCIFSTYLCIYVIMGNEYKDGELLQNASEFYGSVVSKPVAYVFLSLFLVMLLGGEVFCAYLIALHTLLHRKRISTFDLITYRRQLEQMKIIASMQRQN